MTKTVRTVFFGSTEDSVLILKALTGYSSPKIRLEIPCVVTRPPRPEGRTKTPTPSPVESWASARSLPVLSFATDPEKPWNYTDPDNVINAVSTFKPQLLVSASYGQKIPTQLLAEAEYGGLNVHPSLLPRFRGTDPIPWTILSGDRQAGVTVVTLSEKFDQGKLIARKKLPLTGEELPGPLRAELFSLGAGLLAEMLERYLDGNTDGEPQDPNIASYARRITKTDGFIPWMTLRAAMEGNDLPATERPKALSMDTAPLGEMILRAIRAFTPWPGVWTIAEISSRQDNDSAPTDRRIKIVTAHMEEGKFIPDSVQLEGKQPVRFVQFADAYNILPPKPVQTI